MHPQIDLGYEPGENGLLAPASPETLNELARSVGLTPASPLLAFYARCGGIELPDIWNGYFIHTPERVLHSFRNEGPTRVTGPYERDVLLFGSDGGGGLFLLSKDDREDVLHVREGALEQAVLDGATAWIVATSFELYLQRLLDDTEAFLEDREGWTFMV